VLIDSSDSQIIKHPTDTADNDTEQPSRLDFSGLCNRRATTTLVRPAAVGLFLFHIMAGFNGVLWSSLEFLGISALSRKVLFSTCKIR
jgi:hypothetical protein